jgi:hypothetical protein
MMLKLYIVVVVGTSKLYERIDTTNNIRVPK